MGTGCAVWEAADILAELLSAEPARVRGKRVLELGCGCGMLGLAAGALGAREVVLTDEVLTLASHNVDTNFSQQPDLHGRFKVLNLSWGNQEHILATGPPYDVILGSDILWDGAQHDDLAKTLIRLSG